MKYKKNTTD